jgi:KDEL-tailed cysteine endopeptidase
VSIAYEISGWKSVPPKSGSQLQAAVLQQPVSIAVDADFWQHYSSGVYSGACGVQLDHGVLLVGYGIDKSSLKKFWLVKNSWGQSWGENGYIRVLRNDS